MTQEEILMFNKKCAVFIGWKNMGMVNLELWVSGKYPSGIMTSELKFHSDWNWIMEVRDKILSINSYLNVGQRFIFNINACAKFCKNENDKPYKVRIKGVLISEPRPFIKVDSFDEKEAVVQSINQFLIWYEQNK